MTDENRLLLYKRHLKYSGMAEVAVEAKTKIPGSRIDLVEYYTSILQGDIPCPIWAKPLPGKDPSSLVAEVDDILNLEGNFTWFWDQDWFVETRLGNFCWSEPSRGGDGSLTLYQGDHDSFRMKKGIQYGRSEGARIIGEFCGKDIKIVIPA